MGIARALPILMQLRLMLLLTDSVINGVTAAKVGCYDDYPMSCQEHKVPLEEFDWQELEEICAKIDQVVLDGVAQHIWLNASSHPPILNSVDATNEFCPQMQRAYSHCHFCLPPEGVEDCLFSALELEDCGERPSREEVIQDSEEYAWIQSEQDIDRTCNQLEWVHEELIYPRSMDLCIKQSAILHLCPGKCSDGDGCFDEPPTCDLQDNTNLLDERMTFNYWDPVCSQLHSQGLSMLDNKEIFDTATHWDVLRHIPKDNPMCKDYQQAYAHCFWCQGSDSLCFHQDQPPSCEAPRGELDEDLDVVSVCQDILLSMDQFGISSHDLLDASIHASHLFISEDTTLCQQARQVYHQCIWCDQEAQALLLIETEACPPTNVSMTDPSVEETASKILEKLGVASNSASNLTEDECASVAKYYDENLLPHASVQTVREALAAKRLCPQYLCPTNIPPLQDDANLHDKSSNAEDGQGFLWTVRFSACISFLGASFMLHDILKDSEARSMVLHQLLIAIMIFNLVTAAAWGFGGVPLGEDSTEDNGVGSNASCTAQSFFMQLGITSIFYNVSLSIFYVMVIVYHWTEDQLEDISGYLHGIPLTLGLGMAIGGITSYSILGYGCHLQPVGHSNGEVWPVLVFVIVPVGLSTLSITGSLLAVYSSVQKQAPNDEKISPSAYHENKMQRAVFWQSFSYAVAFYVTWPIMFCMYLLSLDGDIPVGLTIAAACVAPVQGFSNFVVYQRTKQRNKRLIKALSQSLEDMNLSDSLDSDEARAPHNGTTTQTSQDFSLQEMFQDEEMQSVTKVNKVKTIQSIAGGPIDCIEEEEECRDSIHEAQASEPNQPNEPQSESDQKAPAVTNVLFSVDQLKLMKYGPAGGPRSSTRKEEETEDKDPEMPSVVFTPSTRNDEDMQNHSNADTGLFSLDQLRNMKSKAGNSTREENKDITATDTQPSDPSSSEASESSSDEESSSEEESSSQGTPEASFQEAFEDEDELNNSSKEEKVGSIPQAPVATNDVRGVHAATTSFKNDQKPHIVLDPRFAADDKDQSEDEACSDGYAFDELVEVLQAAEDYLASSQDSYEDAHSDEFEHDLPTPAEGFAIGLPRLLYPSQTYEGRKDWSQYLLRKSDSPSQTRA